jgi:3-hydroxyisobutyrate dehydrogenase
MGAPMARRLSEKGHSLSVFNRTESKAEALKPLGIEVAKNPKDAIVSAEAVVTMLSDGKATDDVLLDPAVKSVLKGRMVLQMGTISPGESRGLQSAIHAVGGTYLEAPVLGSIPQIEAGDLIVMVGGEDGLLREWQAVLDVFGEVHHIGAVGQAAAMKLALNHLIAALTSAFSLSLSMIQKSKIEVDAFMTILRKSALYAPTYDKKLQRMIDDDFCEPNFPAKWMLKDVTLVLQEAGELGLGVEGLEGIQTLFQRTVREGWGELDYSTVYRSVLHGLQFRGGDR